MSDLLKCLSRNALVAIEALNYDIMGELKDGCCVRRGQTSAGIYDAIASGRMGRIDADGTPR
jgi:hypothetical protein